jgi:hypothetical protein
MPPAPQPASIRFPIDPRDVPAAKAARRLHLSPLEFKALLPRLYARGFPMPDPDTGHYDLKKIEEWMDNRFILPLGNRALDAREVVDDRIERM